MIERITLKPIEGYRPEVSSVWIKNSDYRLYENDLHDLINDATSFSWLKKGDHVFIKLALNSGNRFPATSDPWVLGVLLKILQEKGAGKIIVGDKCGVGHVKHFQDMKKGSSRKLCKSSGLLKVIEKNGATPAFFEERGFDSYIKTSPKNINHWKKPVWITSVVKDVDHIIYMPRVSSHVMGDITCGLKLGVGFLRDDSRLEFHKGGEYFYQMYEEINDIPEINRKLRLTVTSGRKLFTTVGPDMGHVSNPEYGLVMASESLIANELLSYAWLKWNRKFNTPAVKKITSGKITNFRSIINKLFVKFSFVSHGDKKAPPLNFFQAGNIYHHPAIQNYFRKRGGGPEEIIWRSLNKNPDTSIVDYIDRNIKI